ncbi:MAG: FHA domain-containing protein [Eubacterium sp.]|nr:FHA domain-containing protein [Eubacterium sp.]
MNIEYIRNLTGSYMIVKDVEYEYENSELMMLLHNKVPGLLNLQVIISNGKIEYWYEITGTNSLGTMLELFPLNGVQLKRLIEDIYNMNQQIEEFLLDGENVQYFPEFIYFDRKKEKYHFCYLPGSKEKDKNSLQNLAEYLLPKLDHKDAAAVSIGYGFYEKSLQEFCSAEELLSCTMVETEEEIVDAEKPNGKNWTVQEPEAVAMPLSMMLEEEKQAQRQEKRGLFGLAPKKRRKNQTKTQNKPAPDYHQLLAEAQQLEVVAEPLEKDCPTVFLNLEKHLEIGKLVYQGEGKEENFVLEEDMFLVGKDETVVHGVIRADTVSRIHARIFRQEGTYYIEDLNSTNGTYLNGKELFYREPAKLKPLDRIAFATEEYLFG